MSSGLTRWKSYSEKTPNRNKNDCIELLKSYKFVKTKNAAHSNAAGNAMWQKENSQNATKH